MTLTLLAIAVLVTILFGVVVYFLLRQGRKSINEMSRQKSIEGDHYKTDKDKQSQDTDPGTYRPPEDLSVFSNLSDKEK
jgi:cbb3-type cytochrome oxidase subunit 3